VKKLGEGILEKKQKKEQPKHIFYEFQDFAYRLSSDLNDLKHRSLYFRLAKIEKREILQKARDFAIDYPISDNKGSSRAKIFMWAFKNLKDYGKIPSMVKDQIPSTKSQIMTKFQAPNPK